MLKFPTISTLTLLKKTIFVLEFRNRNLVKLLNQLLIRNGAL